MAQKGDRSTHEPIVKALYLSGKTHGEIHEITGVSVTSQTRWKRDYRDPKTGVSSWDLMRKETPARLERTRGLLDRELRAAEKSPPGEIPGSCLQAVIQLGALVRNWEQEEQKNTRELLSSLAEKGRGADVDKPKMFLEVLEWVSKQLKESDPQGLKVLMKNFDYLVDKYKAEYAQAS